MLVEPHAGAAAGRGLRFDFREWPEQLFLARGQPRAGRRDSWQWARGILPGVVDCEPRVAIHVGRAGATHRRALQTIGPDPCSIRAPGMALPGSGARGPRTEGRSLRAAGTL